MWKGLRNCRKIILSEKVSTIVTNFCEKGYRCAFLAGYAASTIHFIITENVRILYLFFNIKISKTTTAKFDREDQKQAWIWSFSMASSVTRHDCALLLPLHTVHVPGVCYLYARRIKQQKYLYSKCKYCSIHVVTYFRTSIYTIV